MVQLISAATGGSELTDDRTDLCPGGALDGVVITPGRRAKTLVFKESQQRLARRVVGQFECESGSDLITGFAVASAIHTFDTRNQP